MNINNQTSEHGVLSESASYQLDDPKIDGKMDQTQKRIHVSISIISAIEEINEYYNLEDKCDKSLR